MRPYTIIDDAGAPTYSDRDGGELQRELGLMAALAVTGYRSGDRLEAVFQLGRLDRFAEESFTADYYRQTVRPWIDAALETVNNDGSARLADGP